MDTLSSQAHTGATDPHVAGLILQRAILIMACLCVPVSVLWFYAERILIRLGQTPELAHMAQQYIWIVWPGLLPNLASACMRKYLQAQGANQCVLAWWDVVHLTFNLISSTSSSLGLMRATTYITFIVWPLNLFSNIFYLRLLKLGFIGAPLAVCTTYFCNFITTILYIRFATDYRKSWGGWSRDAFRGWTEFLRLGELEERELAEKIEAGKRGAANLIITLTCMCVRITFIFNAGVPGMLSVMTDWAFEVCALAAGMYPSIWLIESI